jgi:hypothetical protein
VDVKRAADLYAQGRTLRQIGAELGIPWTAMSHQLCTVAEEYLAHAIATQELP